jgi:His-Xaa-Ser system protein HxsD
MNIEVVKFDKNIYGATSIKKAAYKLIEKMAVNIKEGAEFYEVEISFTKEISKDAKLHYLNDLKKEVLDQDLREKIKKDTESYRNLILAHVFSRTALINDE